MPITDIGLRQGNSAIRISAMSQRTAKDDEDAKDKRLPGTNPKQPLLFYCK
ncbi:hypothetical protein [Xylanibacter rarus]|uniref:hypothetical protein n=1 Tax=Xylanibacter rarus TaxID=1676614 RepID=UPI003FD8A766